MPHTQAVKLKKGVISRSYTVVEITFVNVFWMEQCGTMEHAEWTNVIFTYDGQNLAILLDRGSHITTITECSHAFTATRPSSSSSARLHYALKIENSAITKYGYMIGCKVLKR